MLIICLHWLRSAVWWIRRYQVAPVFRGSDPTIIVWDSRSLLLLLYLFHVTCYRQTLQVITISTFEIVNYMLQYQLIIFRLVLFCINYYHQSSWRVLEEVNNHEDEHIIHFITSSNSLLFLVKVILGLKKAISRSWNTMNFAHTHTREFTISYTTS